LPIIFKGAHILDVVVTARVQTRTTRDDCCQTDWQLTV